jgi:hypothetical protein
MRAATLLLPFLLLCHSVGHAALLPPAERDELVAAVLKDFWGRARQSDGQFIQPSSEAERTTVPVSKPIVERALDAGEISGLGEWCRLKWQPHYLALTKSARSHRLSDTQVAFIAFLHGAAQGRVNSLMSGTRSCGEDERANVQRAIEQSTERGLNGT